MNMILRPIQTSDKKYFLSWWRDKDLIAHTSGNTEKISSATLTRYFENIRKTENSFVICVRNKVIGSIYFQTVGKDIFRFPVVIGEKKYQNRGYGTLAIKAILVFGFIFYKKRKACIEVRPENLRAIHTYKKLGFKEKGIRKIKGNKYLPKVLKMELLKRDWEKTI